MDKEKHKKILDGIASNTIFPIYIPWEQTNKSRKTVNVENVKKVLNYAFDERYMTICGDKDILASAMEVCIDTMVKNNDADLKKMIMNVKYIKIDVDSKLNDDEILIVEKINNIIIEKIKICY
jgi:hypothetical protein